MTINSSVGAFLAEPLVFRLLLLALILGFVAHRAHYTRKYPAQETETLARLQATPTSKFAALLSLIALVASALYIFAPALIGSASMAFPAGLRWVGVGVAISGFVLLEASHRALASNWSDEPRVTQSQMLVRVGPYSRVRHPIYTAFLLILGSSLLISANWLLGLLWLASVGLDVYVRIRFEERELEARFGAEYQDYKSSTGSLFPSI